MNDLLPTSLSSPGSDLPGKAWGLQKEEGGAQGVAGTHPPSTPSPAPLRVLSHSHSLRSKRKPPGKARQGPQSPSEEGDPARRWWPRAHPHVQLALAPSGPPWWEPVPTEACPLPALPRRPDFPRHPSQFGPLNTVPVGGGPGLHSRDQAGGTGLDLWGWSAGRICGLFPEFWSSREGVRKPLWGQGWGSHLEVRGGQQEVEDKKVLVGEGEGRDLRGSVQKRSWLILSPHSRLGPLRAAEDARPVSCLPSPPPPRGCIWILFGGSLRT